MLLFLKKFLWFFKISFYFVVSLSASYVCARLAPNNKACTIALLFLIILLEMLILLLFITVQLQGWGAYVSSIAFFFFSLLVLFFICSIILKIV